INLRMDRGNRAETFHTEKREIYGKTSHRVSGGGGDAVYWMSADSIGAKSSRCRASGRHRGTCTAGGNTVGDARTYESEKVASRVRELALRRSRRHGGFR